MPEFTSEDMRPFSNAVTAKLIEMGYAEGECKAIIDVALTHRIQLRKDCLYDLWMRGINSTTDAALERDFAAILCVMDSLQKAITKKHSGKA